ncbi:MAG: LptF/LptG family permease, partial [Bacteroidota bacterium]
FIFFFIGAPLGAIIRKGGLGLPAVISVIFFILYYIISLAGEKFVKEDILPAYIGMWIASIILLPSGIFLTYKATTDSVILSTENYMNLIKKIFRRKNLDPSKKFNMNEKIAGLDEQQILNNLEKFRLSSNNFLDRFKRSKHLYFNEQEIDQYNKLVNNYREIYGQIYAHPSFNLKYNQVRLYLLPHLKEKSKNNNIAWKIIYFSPLAIFAWTRNIFFKNKMKRKIKTILNISSSIINYMENRI